jgi:hypothetical protein
MLTFEYRVCPDARAQGLGCDLQHLGSSLCSFGAGQTENIPVSVVTVLMRVRLVSARTCLPNCYQATNVPSRNRCTATALHVTIVWDSRLTLYAGNVDRRTNPPTTCFVSAQL